VSVFQDDVKRRCGSGAECWWAVGDLFESDWRQARCNDQTFSEWRKLGNADAAMKTLKEGEQQRGYKPRRPGNVTKGAHKRKRSNERSSRVPLSDSAIAQFDGSISNHSRQPANARDNSEESV